MSRQRRSDEEIQEAKLMGQALATLRMSRGLTQGQVAQGAGLTTQRICKTERGYSYPRQYDLKRILGAMGLSFAALHRAQELVQDPMGEVAEPIDAPDFAPRSLEA
jgi:transcriptional regulator with XRE-family HTH domain